MLDFVYKNVSVPILGVGKTTHPMANFKSAKKLIAELPPYNAAKALEEVTGWLASVIATPEFKLDYRFELLDLLDQTAKSFQRKLVQEYLARNRHDKTHQHRLSTIMCEFWKMLAHAYAQCIEQFQGGALGTRAAKKHMSAIVARAMRALTQQLKWTFQRYGPVDDHLWNDLGRLYLFAEAEGFATTVTAIYPETNEQGTVQREFLKALMLAVSSTDSLTPLKQEIAERTVAHLCDMYSLHSQQQPTSNYFFDLSLRKRPARTLAGIESHDMMRFFGAGPALAALEQLAREIIVKKVTPPGIDLGSPVRDGIMLSVMQHLTLYWSDRQPTRRSERRNVETSLTVVHSYKQVLKKMLPENEDYSLDFQAQYASESWNVENVNDGGFGVAIPSEKGDWISVGSLLGLQVPESQLWGIGLVRRISHDQNQQRRVGIELLSRTGIPVTLTPVTKVSSITAAHTSDAAVLLSTTPDQMGEIDLLLPEGTYTPAQALQMNVRSKRYQLLPSRVVEGGDDYDLAKFKVIGRQ